MPAPSERARAAAAWSVLEALILELLHRGQISREALIGLLDDAAAAHEGQETQAGTEGSDPAAAALIRRLEKGLRHRTGV